MENEILTVKYLDNLQYSWTAVVQLQNDQITPIWYTALPMLEKSIKKVISVSSDYPKHEIK